VTDRDLCGVWWVDMGLAVSLGLLLISALVGCSGQTSHAAPLVALQSVEAGGSSIRAISGQTFVEYTPGRYFGIAFLVKNRSGRSVTITRITGTDSGPRFVRLVGVRVVPFTPRPCPGKCPAPSLGLKPPYREIPSFRRLTLAPGSSAGVVLHFRWVPCGSAPRKATERDNRMLRVDYEVNGRRAMQLVPTATAGLAVRSSGCA
jgi:hypothetical protein